MKKWFFLLILFGIGIIWYLNKSKSSESDKNPQYRDTTIASSSKDEPKTLKSNLPANSKDIEQVKKVETIDPKFEEFDKIENAWLKSVEGLLNKEEYSYYLQLREVNEKEKMDAYQAYHDYLRAKNGNNFSYRITEDQSIREKKINEKYLQMLQKKIGNQRFQTYLSQRDQFNEKTRRNKNSPNAIVIEF